MNKKLLTAAITAGLMMPGLAAADVKIFGVVQIENGNVDIDTQGGTDTSTTIAGGKNGAINGGGNQHIGVKGTEKLGNGLSVYFKANWEYDNYDSNVAFNARDRFLGIKGKGWNVQFGKMNSMWKTSSVKLDPFVTTGLQARGVGAVGGGHNAYADNVVQVGFKSGSWSGGFDIKVEDPSGETDATNTSGSGSDRVDIGSWSGKVHYNTKTWGVGFAMFNYDYDAPTGGGATAAAACAATTANATAAVTCPVATTTAATVTTGDSGDTDGWKLSGKWKGNGFTVSAVYEDISSSNDAAGSSVRPDGGSTMMGTGGKAAGAAKDYDSLSVNVTYKLSGSTTLMARYANADWDDDGGVLGDDQELDSWAIGVKHNLSKRTFVYGGYMDNEYDNNGVQADQDVDVWAIGMMHKF